MTRRLLLPVAVALLATAGCGVPAESTPRPIPATASPAASTTTPATTPSAGPRSAVDVLYLVRDGSLVAVRRPPAAPTTLQALLDKLMAGPTQEEHDAGLSTALTGLGTGATVSVQQADATVDLGTRPANAERSDEVLAYGQLVCTLTGRPGVDTVSFRYDGQPVAVPRADGSLARQPLTAADYAPLVAHG